MEIDRSDELVMRGWVVLGIIVGPVGETGEVGPYGGLTLRAGAGGEANIV